jgi:hypothetical protein
MKILLRKYDNEYYVWKDAVYKEGNFFIDDCLIYQTNILAIKDDNRKDSVICAYCGKVIKNDPEEIEKHFTEQEAQRDCFKCTYLRKQNFDSKEATFTKTENGKFVVKETYHADLKCGVSWYGYPPIDSNDAKRICIFYKCRNAGVMPIKDIFTQYDDPFNKNITVDLLQEKKFVAESYANGFFEYDLKCRNTIKACVNELGIVDHFIIKHRGYKFMTYYSAKYDKLFFSENRRDYQEDIPSGMSQAKYDQAKAKISALYKEENANE